MRKEKEEGIWIKEGKGSKEEEDLKEVEIKMRGLEIRMEQKERKERRIHNKGFTPVFLDVPQGIRISYWLN